MNLKALWVLSVLLSLQSRCPMYCRATRLFQVPSHAACCVAAAWRNIIDCHHSIDTTSLVPQLLQAMRPLQLPSHMLCMSWLVIPRCSRSCKQKSMHLGGKGSLLLMTCPASCTPRLCSVRPCGSTRLSHRSLHWYFTMCNLSTCSNTASRAAEVPVPDKQCSTSCDHGKVLHCHNGIEA